jgi:hypothetical protein
MELVLLNRTLSAREALDWGIANRVVSDASLAEEVHSTAANSLQGLRELMERRKRLMYSVLLKASKQIEMELAGSRLWRIPRTLARQSRLSRPSGHRYSPGAEMALPWLTQLASAQDFSKPVIDIAGKRSRELNAADGAAALTSTLHLAINSRKQNSTRYVVP